MGQVVTRMCAERGDCQVVAGFDIMPERKNSYPVYADPLEFAGPADVVIDFSNPAALDRLLSYCVRRHLPVILCTTGYGPEHLDAVRKASEQIPVFKSGNMSVGINLLTVLLKKAAAVLGENFDVEIVERHHRTKLDAPSGTALMLADAIASSLPYKSEYVYERESVRRKRGKEEIGISSVRGGTIVGEHEVVFAGTDEVLEFKHTAYSREVFANGAVTAALFMAGITVPGLYDMNDALTELLSR
jgi:4-hydroxy-tetrahydrodipicolinate reductase